MKHLPSKRDDGMYSGKGTQRKATNYFKIIKQWKLYKNNRKMRNSITKGKMNISFLADFYDKVIAKTLSVEITLWNNINKYMKNVKEEYFCKCIFRKYLHISHKLTQFIPPRMSYLCILSEMLNFFMYKHSIGNMQKLNKHIKCSVIWWEEMGSRVTGMAH